jgi:type IV fimbrial biogenesis protein FimT
MKYILNTQVAGQKRARSAEIIPKLRGKGRRRPQPKPKKRGWRLTGTELIIAVASLSVVLLLAYPSFQGIAINRNLKIAVRDLVADFDVLREKAVVESAPLTLTFDVPGNTYRSPGLPNGLKSPANIAPDISLIQASFGGENRLIFLAKGTLSQQGNIVLTNSRGSTATITCSLSGRTYVKFLMQ